MRGEKKNLYLKFIPESSKQKQSQWALFVGK